MSLNVSATFENGVFRPTEPLAIANGTAVHLTVDAQPLPETVNVLEVDAFLKSLRGAKDLDQLAADYDFLKALDSNRLTGEPSLFATGSAA